MKVNRILTAQHLSFLANLLLVVPFALHAQTWTVKSISIPSESPRPKLAPRAACGHGHHALIWSGFADSSVDLHVFLPSRDRESYALGVGSAKDFVYDSGSTANIGDSPLRGLRVVMTRVNKAECLLTGPSRAPLAPNASASFRRTCMPKAAGNRKADLLSAAMPSHSQSMATPHLR